MQSLALLEDRYWSLLESTQRLQYPKFVAFLTRQQDAEMEEGRAAMINFRNGAKPLISRLHTSDDLRKCLDKPHERLDQPHESKPVVRRLFILEGLPKDFILALGSRLRVPPSFFSAHWIDSQSFLGNIVNRSPRHHENPYQFQLSFAKLHRARIEAKPSDASEPIYWTNSCIPRRLSRWTIFGDLDGPLTSFEKASFWGTPPSDTSGERSWDGKCSPPK